MPYIARPVSRFQIRKLAWEIRKAVGYENKPYFPIVEFMENIMPIMFKGFNYEIAKFR